LYSARLLAIFTLVASICAVAPATTVGKRIAKEQPSLPQVSAALPETSVSHAFLASDHLKQPMDLAKYGYIEEEYLITGQARVFDWPREGGPTELGKGSYTTRILVRRPSDDRKFNGTVIVEPFNPSSPVDLPIMWAQSYEQFMADGYAWVGVTIKPNTIRALKAFDPQRYASLAMPNPLPHPSCNAKEINAWAQPTTPADETGLAFDMLSQIGALLKSRIGENPLSRPAIRLYLTGQSQTAGYSRTYATVFGQREIGPNDKLLYDAYIYSGSPPWQVPLNQCIKDFPPGDPRLLTGAAGVPIIEMFVEGDIGSNIETRRPDSDTAPDLFRRYEIAGASHVDPWEQLSFASTDDTMRASGQADPIRDVPSCEPTGVQLSDFPVRYVFDEAWRNLDEWVRNGVAPPHGTPLELIPGVHAGSFVPDQAFVLDAYGNAEGGVRTPYVDVPTARWVGARRGGFGCFFQGYKFPFDQAKLKSLYGDHAAYVAKVRASVSELQQQHWLTPADSAAIVREAERIQIP
jgi:hypothetical protein